jgi:hypothetical protein
MMTSVIGVAMANTNTPFGFRQYSGTGSSPTYEQTTLQQGAMTYNQAVIYYGDPVIRNAVGDATIKQGIGSGSVIPLVGIFAGCKYLSAAIGRTVWSNYWPGGSPVASTAQSTIEAYVINDPVAQFLCQSDSTGVQQADQGSNMDFNIGTGTAANGLSGAFLIHTGATTATLPFRFLSLVWAPPGANGVATSGAAAAYNYAIVGFNALEAKALTAYNT